MNRHYVVFLVLLALITLISHLLRAHLELINIALIHLIPVLVIALRGNMGATLVASLASVLLLNVLYVPPLYSFTVDDAFYLWSFLIFFIVGTIIALQAKQIQSSKIKEVLLNTLSHDLKTPLSSIIGNTTFLLDQHPLPKETQKEVLREMQHTGEQMNRLVSNLLDNARLQDTHRALKMDWCDLEDSFGVALQEFPSQESRLVLNIQQDMGLYWGDCTLLVRLFVNLLDNAFKYSAPEKHVRVTISCTKKKVTLLFFNHSAPFDKSELHNIFDKFYRMDTTADIHGSGIGLSICKKIVQAHQGDIRAFAKDDGIYFQVTLPYLKYPPKLSQEHE